MNYIVSAYMPFCSNDETDTSRDICRTYVVRGRRRTTSFCRWLWSHQKEVVPEGHILGSVGVNPEDGSAAKRGAKEGGK